MPVRDALATLFEYLEKTGADEKTLEAFSVLRDRYTNIIGSLLELTAKMHDVNDIVLKE